MIQIIAGEKGRGKTKILLDKVNTEVKAAKGVVVYIDKNIKHMYELNNKIRLVNIKDYFVENYSEFIGFLYGIISCDHDIQSIYLDSFLKIAFVNEENIKPVFEKLENISKQFNVDFMISLSMNVEQLPENIKDYVIVTL